MTHEEPHTDPQVEELLSSLSTHAKDVRRQTALMELVDYLAAEPPVKRRPLWPYWTGVAIAACMALVLIMRQDDAPQMAMSSSNQSKEAVYEDRATDCSPANPIKSEPQEPPMENNQKQSSLSNPQSMSTPEEVYAYSETESGIRVYCENQCNAEEVVAHVEEIVRQSIVAL